jgi:prepilin-type processing-associated H-X9-DG protein
MKRVVNISVFLLLLGAAMTGAVWGGERIAASRLNARCVENLESIGAALRTYSNVESNRDFFPPLSLTRGRMMFDPDALYPELLSETTCFVSPFHPDHASLRSPDSNSASLIDDASYWYLGYLIANERSALAWIEEYRRLIPEGRFPENIDTIWPEYQEDVEARKREDETRREQAEAEWIASGRIGPSPREIKWGFVSPMPHERHTYYRLKQGVERFLITEIGNPASSAVAQSVVPVMVERPELHGNGGHVLYMDGHVEFLLYPGPFPMTEPFVEALRSLDQLESP